MKCSDIITTDLRSTIDDKNASTWSDEVLRGFILDAVARIQRDEPDSRLNDDGSMRPIRIDAFTANTDDIPLDHVYREAIRNYVCFRCFSSDAADDNDQKQAAMHQAAFTDFFKSKG